MRFKCGIVGLPDIERSTLPNTLTEAGIEAVNSPSCATEPNIGVVSTPDPRLDQLTKVMKPQCTPSTTMEFVDTASLVKDVSKGEGLGNQFPTNTRETEAIGHAVHCSENDNIIRVPDRVNLVDNIEVINTRPVLADSDTCERVIHCVQKKVKGGDKDAKTEPAVLEKCLPQLENAGMPRALDLSAKEKAVVRYLSFLTLKPTMYIANVNKDGLESNPYLDQVREIAAREGFAVVPVCATVKAGIVELNDEERDELMQELGLEEPGLDRVIYIGYKPSNPQTYSIAGVKEVHAQAIPVGATASQTAGKIRTDFEKGFVRARTISFEDFITYKGEQGTKEVGKTHAEGKDCTAKGGDVMNSLFNV